jgi:hypothetical protein
VEPAGLELATSGLWEGPIIKSFIIKSEPFITNKNSEDFTFAVIVTKIYL